MKHVTTFVLAAFFTSTLALPTPSVVGDIQVFEREVTPTRAGGGLGRDSQAPSHKPGFGEMRGKLPPNHNKRSESQPSYREAADGLALPSPSVVDDKQVFEREVTPKLGKGDHEQPTPPQRPIHDPVMGSPRGKHPQKGSKRSDSEPSY